MRTLEYTLPGIYSRNSANTLKERLDGKTMFEFETLYNEEEATITVVSNVEFGGLGAPTDPLLATFKSTVFEVIVNIAGGTYRQERKNEGERMMTKEELIEAIEDRLGYGNRLQVLDEEEIVIGGNKERRFIFQLHDVDLYIDIRKEDFRFEYRIHGTNNYSGLSFPKTLKGITGKVAQFKNRR